MMIFFCPGWLVIIVLSIWGIYGLIKLIELVVDKIDTFLVYRRMGGK